MKIECNKLFCLDLRDDFEEIGRGEKNFELDNFLQDDLNRAFGFGYCCKDWVSQQMWFPVEIRKEIRHLEETLKDYIPQLKWLNSKYKQDKSFNEYATYIINNIFCDDYHTLLRFAIFLGMYIKTNEKH